MQDLAVIGRILARGIGIHLPANILDFLGNLKRAATPRSLERHMFKHMGNAVDIGCFVARTHINPRAKRYGLNMFKAVGRNDHPVVKPGELDCHIALLLCFISCPRITVFQAARRLSRTCAINAPTSLDMGSTFSGRSYRSDSRSGKSG